MKILIMLVLGFAVSAGNPAAKSPYAGKVRRTSAGEVYIRINVKRQKGETCNPTSMSMILRHFGIFASSEKLLKAGKETEAYKYSGYLQKELEKYNMKMLFIPYKHGHSGAYTSVVRAINCGLPLQWLVDLLKAPDYDIEPRRRAALAKQGPVAGHARIINGYTFNKKSRRLEKFIFTDPWGTRRQEIKFADAGVMTVGFFLIVPAKLDQEIIKYILAPAYGK